MASHRRTPLGLCFIGCGRATELHSRVMRILQKPIRRFYASRDPSRAQLYCRRFHGSGYFESYKQALESHEISAVVICTPPMSHLSLVLDVLDHEKDVIVEKPAFASASDVRSVRAVQERGHHKVLVAENYFYKPLVCRLRQLIASECVGEIVFIAINAVKYENTTGWRDDPALALQGSLFEAGVHWINLMANIGPVVTAVQGHLPANQGRLEKSIMVTFTFDSGAVGSLLYSREVPSGLHGVRLSHVHGRSGSIVFESNGLVVIANGKRKRLYLPNIFDIGGYFSMWSDFINALSTRQDEQINLEIIERDLAIVEAVYQSLEHGRPSQLDLGSG